MRPIAIIGNVNVDMILGPVVPWPQPGTETIVSHDELRVGGSAGNSALALMGLGLPFQLIANIGKDQFGRFLADGFATLQCDWTVSDTSTTLSVGMTHPDGERTFLTTTGHLPHFSLADVQASLKMTGMKNGIALLCGGFLTDRLAADYAPLFDWLDQHEIAVALDTGWPVEGWTEHNRERAMSWLMRSQIVLFNEVETTNLAGTVDVLQAARDLCRAMPENGLFVVKCGPQGAFAVNKHGLYEAVSAPEVQVIDTIGAGDVFNAGFLAAFAAGRPIADCLQQAVSIASRAVSTSPRNYSIFAEGGLA